MARDVDVGAAAEHLFAGELLARGAMVAWPSSQTQPYDLIADIGNHRYKIQVKGTISTADKVYRQFVKRDGKKKRTYSKKDIDFLVLHLFAYSAWYIFPVGEVRNAVTVQPMNRSCRYARYLNAWHLLDKSLR